MKSSAGILIPVLLFSISIAGEIVPFDDQHWDLTRARVSEHMGRTSLSGRAILKEGVLGDGTIEVDVALSGERTFPGIIFRMKDPNNYETIYIRPHKSGLPDAIQYAPSFNGNVSWQTYSGKGYIGPARFPTKTWNHLAIEIRGYGARLIMNGELIMEIPYLEHGPVIGGMGLNSRTDDTAFFSNFRFTPLEPVTATPPHREAPAGAVKNWQMARAVATEGLDLETYPSVDAADWRPVSAENTGILDISRFLAKTNKSDTLPVRTLIKSEKGGRIKLTLAYSDRLDLFHNGRKVFSANGAYLARHETYLGIVSLHDSIYLTLEPGENELLALVSEEFGGWALWWKSCNPTPSRKRGARLGSSDSYGFVFLHFFLNNFPILTKNDYRVFQGLIFSGAWC